MAFFFKELSKIPELNLNPTMEQLNRLKHGGYTVSRIDINETWHLPSRDDVFAWINAAGQKMRLKHRGAGQFSGDTLYWGKGSRRWVLKCYSKGDEINSKKVIFLMLYVFLKCLNMLIEPCVWRLRLSLIS